MDVIPLAAFPNLGTTVGPQWISPMDETSSGPEAMTCFLLAGCRYADVLQQSAGAAPAEARRRHIALSEEEWARRRPPPPALLLDAMQDRPALPVGKVRIAHPEGRKKKPVE